MKEADEQLINRILDGEEEAFVFLVATYQPTLLRIAEAIVPSRALAEEIVQESWVAALACLEAFQYRSSLKTWLCSIVINRAKNLATREARIVSSHEMSDDLGNAAIAAEEEEQPALRERLSEDGRHWVRAPARWSPEQPELFIRRRQAVEALQKALQELPTSQRAVVILRDIEGLSSDEVRDALSLSAANQRVLLHRGRNRLRTLLEAYADGI